MGKYFDDNLTIEEKKEQTTKFFAERLKIERAKNGKKQDELSGAIGFTPNNGAKISKLEKEKGSLGYEYLSILADSLNTTVESFYSSADEIINYNPINRIMMKMNTKTDDKSLIMKYMDHLTETAIKKVGADILFDIIYVVIRYTSFGHTDSKLLEEQLSIVNQYHNEKEASMCINRALTYAKELVEEN